MGQKRRRKVDGQGARPGQGRAGYGLEAVRAKIRAARLTRAQILCLTMQWFYDLNQQEVAQHLGISQQAVSTLVNRGLERLAAVGVRRRRRRQYQLPQVIHAPYSWLDQLSPEEVKAGW